MKKEHYRHRLPHFHTPGQIYFVTWALKDSIPRHALKNYSQQIEILERKIDQTRENKSDDTIISALRGEYYQIRRKYLKSLHHLLDLEKQPEVNLSKHESAPKRAVFVKVEAQGIFEPELTCC